MQGPVKIIILTEDGNVKEVYGPGPSGVEYFFIDRDEESEEPIHVTGWQPGLTYAELKQHNPKEYRMAFGRKKVMATHEKPIFSKREVATILAALRYFQADRDDAREALEGHFEGTRPLTCEEIDELCEQINFLK